MTDPIEPRIVRPEDHDGVPNAPTGGDVYSTLARGEHTHGGYYLTHAIVPPGGGPPAHVHSREEEAFFVLRETVTFALDDREVVAGAGRSSTSRAAPGTASTTPRTTRPR